MCCGCILEARKNKYHLWGNEYKQSEVEMAKYIYIFYISKIYEFVDTFIMLLKGNIKPSFSMFTIMPQFYSYGG